MNDFNIFFDEHPAIKYVFFNGEKSRKSFVRSVTLDPIYRSTILFRGLPSTSPANTHTTINEKIVEWSEVKKYLEKRDRFS